MRAIHEIIEKPWDLVYGTMWIVALFSVAMMIEA